MTTIRLKTPMPLHKLTDTTPRNDTTRYEIVPMTVDMSEQPPEIDGHTFFYGKSGAAMSNDKGVADAIKDKYGRKVEIFETKGQWHPSDKGHRYFFGVLRKALPWHKYDKNGMRIKEVEDEVDTKSNQTQGSVQCEGEESG